MMKNNINYQTAVFRRNNHGSPCIWYGEVIGEHSINVHYGILGKTITIETINTSPRKGLDELISRYKSKGKTGYKYLSEIKDNNTLPVEELHLISYLEAYLPHDRSTSDGAMLPMLAKLYDNTDNKLFKNDKRWIAQPKINGLRCEIGATSANADMFKPIRLTFQSREGTYWNSLDNLESYLLSQIPSDLLKLMVEEDYMLDGELYLYGHAVNEINHIVKDPRDPKNKLLQYWCYDVAVLEMSQDLRSDLIEEHLGKFQYCIDSHKAHENVDDRLVMLQSYNCNSHSSATSLRNMFIDWGFEGLILRDPDKDYQYGKRNSAMHKYKALTDGIFVIVDIVSEGNKRPDIPLLVLKNDINAAKFSVHITGSFEYQKNVLLNKEEFIDRKVFVEYGERSGVNQLPFHVKTVNLINE